MVKITAIESTKAGLTLQPVTPSKYTKLSALAEQNKDELALWGAEVADTYLNPMMLRRRIVHPDHSSEWHFGIVYYDILVGAITLVPVPSSGQMIGRVAFWVGSIFSDRDYARKAVEALTYIASNPDVAVLERFESYPGLNDETSQQVLENAGFIRVNRRGAQLRYVLGKAAASRRGP